MTTSCGVVKPRRCRGAEEHQPPVGLDAVGLEVGLRPSVGLIEEDRGGVVALGGKLVGHVTEIEVTENAVELGHVDVGDAGIAWMSSIFSSFCSSESGEKFAEPLHTRGSSESGSISRNLVWTKNTKPSFLGRYSSSLKNHLSSANSWIGLRAVGLSPFIV